ncbi:hypothetical protein BN873_330073 [Candidatus Competibacter denitrificans Run_A_D11]|uniref:Uncharacterized protein n=1 Tax=Candidatus Competibacter denitrificans Run_A_D11 TaxID=1400863 RepID=W6M465_9GAMM|nr:hypothetical protein BN873_330073 [Candidatus Competibacter denitrificans Run_A_D11]
MQAVTRPDFDDLDALDHGHASLWLVSPRGRAAAVSPSKPTVLRRARRTARRLAPFAVRIGSTVTPTHRAWRSVFSLVTEAEAAGQHTAFHAWITGFLQDMLANAIQLMRTTPTAHRFCSPFGQLHLPGGAWPEKKVLPSLIIVRATRPTWKTGASRRRVGTIRPAWRTLPTPLRSAVIILPVAVIRSSLILRLIIAVGLALITRLALRILRRTIRPTLLGTGLALITRLALRILRRAIWLALLGTRLTALRILRRTIRPTLLGAGLALGTRLAL